MSAARPAPLEPFQEAISSTLSGIEGPNPQAVRRLVYEAALIAYELGWDIAHGTRDAEESAS
jgi:hypothetical protein